MNFSKIIFFIATVSVGFGLLGSQSSSRLTADEIEKIKAKYGLSTSSKQSAPVKDVINVRPSVASDLAGTDFKKESQSTAVKKETAQTGKTLQNQLDKAAVEVLDKEINNKEGKEELKEMEEEVKKVEKDPENVVDEAPGLLKSIFGLPKLWYRINQFNSTASQNIKRFSTTFNNVGASLASLDEDFVLMPKKNKSGDYVTGANKVIAWEKVAAKNITSDMVDQLKNECQYIIIKEMVDGFRHLQPVIGPVLDAFYYLAPKLASQSRLIYDTASQFLPMLETLAKDNLNTMQGN